MCNWVSTNFLSLINLFAFVLSVIFLFKTMKATERQVERTSSPVIVLRRTDFNLPNGVLEPQINVEALIPFQMKNVGSGTAIEVHWRFKTASDEGLIHGMIPQLQPGHILKTHLTAEKLGIRQGVSRVFECDYRSVNGDSYRSRIKIEDTKIVEFTNRKVSSA